MAKYQIIAGGCVCCDRDSKGRCWGFTLTEEQAQDRVASLAEVGISATYEPIDNTHWVNNWIG